LKFRTQFDALTATQDEKLVKKWEALDMTPRQDNGEWYSVHSSNWKKGKSNEHPIFFHDSCVIQVLALRDSDTRLCQKENDTELLGQGKSGASAFINKGLGLEADK
jgi:hypothetical protein